SGRSAGSAARNEVRIVESEAGEPAGYLEHVPTLGAGAARPRARGGGRRVVARRRLPRARVPVRGGRSVRARGKGRARPARLLAARQRAPVRRGGPVLLLAPAVCVLPPRTRPARPAPAPHARARAPAGRIAAARPHRRRSAELLSRRGAPDARRRPHQERGGVAAAAHGGGPGLPPAVGRRPPALSDVSRAHVPPAAVRLPLAGGAGGGVPGLRGARAGAAGAARGALPEAAVESVADPLIPLRTRRTERGRDPRPRSDALPAARGSRRKHGRNPEDDPPRSRPAGALSRSGQLAGADAPRVWRRRGHGLRRRAPRLARAPLPRRP